MRTLYHSLAAAVLAVGLLFTAMAPAAAGPFDNVNNFMRAQPGVPADFTLDPTEFGPNNFVRVVHLTGEFVIGLVNGYVIVWNAAEPSKPIFVDAGKGYSEPAQTEASIAACGPGHWFITTVGTNPENNQWCTPAHLVGKSGGSTYVGDTAPIAKNCDIQVNGLPHSHSCDN